MIISIDFSLKVDLTGDLARPDLHNYFGHNTIRPY